MKYLEAAAKKGGMIAQRNIGIMYYTGDHCEKNVFQTTEVLRSCCQPRRYGHALQLRADVFLRLGGKKCSKAKAWFQEDAPTYLHLSYVHLSC
jgi:TPR repeat protein